jgi:hypothetical protein
MSSTSIFLKDSSLAEEMAEEVVYKLIDGEIN